MRSRFSHRTYGAGRVLAFDKRGAGERARRRPSSGRSAAARWASMRLSAFRDRCAPRYCSHARKFRCASVTAAARARGSTTSASTKEGAHARDRLVASRRRGSGLTSGPARPTRIWMWIRCRRSAFLRAWTSWVAATGTSWSWHRDRPGRRSSGRRSALARRPRGLVRPGRDRVVVIGMPHDRPLAAEIATEVAARGGRYDRCDG